MKYMILFLLATFLWGCSQPQSTREDGMNLAEKVKQFAPTEIRYDHSLLDDRQKVVLEKLFHAAQIMDTIFLKQVYDRNEEIARKLAADTTASGRARQAYFDIMYGPFDRLDHDKPFYGTASKPAGANFYPADMSKEEFESWLESHPQDRAAFTSEFTVIRRRGDKLVAIPYSEIYKDELTRAATLLREAAGYADNPSLKKYLLSRAEAFLSNDYFQSDMDWMDLKDHTIEVVIGPYEVYEDGLFNYKAAFECFLTLRDPEESAKLKVFAGYLDDMEKHLPIEDRYKNFNRGGESPIVVVQEVFASGDARANIQTLAFNLPNDERVREAKGSKKVMLKNIHEAKFKQLLRPIAERVIEKDEVDWVTFDGFFNHTLMHEMSHGIGPGKLVLNGRKTEVKSELKETYSTIEECKADVLGMYNNFYMIEKGVFRPEFAKEIWVSFLAGVFRSVRFGVNEAHGAGNAIILNYMYENGAYVYNEESDRMAVDFQKAPKVLKELATRLLMIQARGDYAGSKAMIERYAGESAILKKMTAKLKDLPVDIRPVFQIEEEAR
ncbi:MAG TPA: peptidase [Caldithrix abyssi]|uniref:Peptidase n=1 Tax=Caldithrix abyssi TaxID=187145 RepID=A0A7V1LN10_CALAY|nr:peptidase [Caldithrix abyssi]